MKLNNISRLSVINLLSSKHLSSYLRSCPLQKSKIRTKANQGLTLVQRVAKPRAGRRKKHPKAQHSLPPSPPMMLPKTHQQHPGRAM